MAKSPITAKIAYEIATDFSANSKLQERVNAILEEIEKRAYNGYLTYRSNEITANFGKPYYDSIIQFFKKLGYKISNEEKNKYYYLFTLSWDMTEENN